MATTRITLSDAAWTDISQGAINGLVTNESLKRIKIKDAASLPGAGDIDGHTMYPGENGFFNWAGIVGNIYARALPGTGDLDVEVSPQ